MWTLIIALFYAGQTASVATVPAFESKNLCDQAGIMARNSFSEDSWSGKPKVVAVICVKTSIETIAESN